MKQVATYRLINGHEIHSSITNNITSVAIASYMYMMQQRDITDKISDILRYALSRMVAISLFHRSLRREEPLYVYSL